VYNAPWSLAGEAGASHRPKDSLLDEVLDFEHAMKAVPVVTEHSTLALEERIRRRIKNKAFDDVERKSSKSVPQDLLASSARGTRRDSAADAERSKLSLMDLYEKEYLEKIRRAEQAEGQQTTAAVDPLTEIEKDELRAVQMWKRLAQHLDALSNFFYAPKPVQQDLDARVRAVEHQAPAIVIESVGNFAASRAAALAPQDLYRHDIRNKFVGVATDEMDPREKRALRRAKKDSFAATKTRKTKKAVDKAAARALATERKKGEGKRERVSQATKANPS
jgi:U3 small nucleolar RNA-associated protein MPP10